MRKSPDGRPDFIEVERPHRDNGHLFILQEKGTTLIEVDFRKYHIRPSSILYIHPDQIHRLITFEKATVASWIITSENLHQDNLKLLTALKPVTPLAIEADTLAVISDTASLCIQFSERKQERLYDTILKESLNTLVTLVASQYIAQTKSADSYARFEIVTQSFKSSLEDHFTTVKSPTVYAGYQHISTPYLNECVNAATGHSVSWHIQQRVVLEAKRLLYHSDKSIKEIAGELGYGDYSYFTRLFVKVAGMTPVAFRSKNHD
ncbi:AraC family transcriptional regulator [Chitinophaga arvensicola]|nr:helix-turn-helix transcriptional regulator [Chitinophaga arvensicola]